MIVSATALRDTRRKSVQCQRSLDLIMGGHAPLRAVSLKHSAGVRRGLCNEDAMLCLDDREPAGGPAEGGGGELEAQKSRARLKYSADLRSNCKCRVSQDSGLFVQHSRKGFWFCRT